MIIEPEHPVLVRPPRGCTPKWGRETLLAKIGQLTVEKNCLSRVLGK